MLQNEPAPARSSPIERASSPGRPRGFDVDQALDAAMRVFWHQGYRTATTRDLVAALGLGQSSISSAFGTKAELADLALARYLGRLESDLIGPLRDAADGLDAVDRFLGGLCDWLFADGGRGCMVGRLMSDGAHAEPRIAGRIAEYRSLLRTALDAALARAVACGELSPEGLDERRDLVVTTILGLNLAVQAGYDAQALRGLERAARAQVAEWGRAPARPV